MLLYILTHRFQKLIENPCSVSSDRSNRTKIDLFVHIVIFILSDLHLCMMDDATNIDQT